MPGDLVEPHALLELLLRISRHGGHDLSEFDRPNRLAEKAMVDLGEQHGVMISGTAEHDA